TIFLIANVNNNIQSGTGVGGSLNFSGSIIAPSGFTLTLSGSNPITISGNNTSFFGNFSINGGGRTDVLSSTGQLRRANFTSGLPVTANFDMSNLPRESGTLNWFI